MLSGGQDLLRGCIWHPCCETSLFLCLTLSILSGKGLRCAGAAQMAPPFGVAAGKLIHMLWYPCMPLSLA